MILLIDNYDSFVHNLARYVRELGEDAVVRRNDEVTLGAIVLQLTVTRTRSIPSSRNVARVPAGLAFS